jgi:hypothetical protein
VMGGGGRSSTGDEEGGAGDASSGPEFEVGAPHRTGTGPAPPLVHLRRGLRVGVVIPHSLPRARHCPLGPRQDAVRGHCRIGVVIPHSLPQARHCPWDPDKMRSAGTAMGGKTRLGGRFSRAVAELQSSTVRRYE